MQPGSQCGWKARPGAGRPALVRLGYLARLGEGRGWQAPGWLDGSEVGGAVERLCEA